MIITSFINNVIKRSLFLLFIPFFAVPLFSNDTQFENLVEQVKSQNNIDTGLVYLYTGFTPSTSKDFPDMVYTKVFKILYINDSVLGVVIYDKMGGNEEYILQTFNQTTSQIAKLQLLYTEDNMPSILPAEFRWFQSDDYIHYTIHKTIYTIKDKKFADASGAVYGEYYDTDIYNETEIFEKYKILANGQIAKVYEDTGNHQQVLIEGNNIWVRETPKTGRVVMKLNDGDRCILLDSTSMDTIRGFIDRWYKIVHDNDTGWVYGSQTNIKTEQSKQLFSFLNSAKRFLRAFAEHDFPVLNQFIYNGTAIHCLQSGQGAYPEIVSFTDFSSFFDRNTSSMKYPLDGFSSFCTKMPSILYGRFDKCEDGKGVVGARYGRKNNYKQISSTERALYKYLYNEEITPEIDANLNKINQTEQLVSFYLSIKNMSNSVEFFFYFKAGRWYVAAIDAHDCSA